MSWRTSIACTRVQAENAGEIEGAVLVATEEDEAADRWRLDIYTEDEPGAATIADIAALGAGAPAVERLADEDWVTLSQSGLVPIREGRFIVHTSAFPIAADRAAGERAFLIEAGQAFGTGHHQTTAGCLAMADAIARSGSRFERIIDLGTGTGLLAFAAAELWPMAEVTATDIDPVAIDVTRGNAATNDVVVGDDIGEISLIVADGARDPRIEAGGPYDLVIANILAGPLIAMAPEIAGIAAPGATLILAGLLTSQADAVERAYDAAGCAPVDRLARGDWTILRLLARSGAATGEPASGDRNGWASDGA